MAMVPLSEVNWVGGLGGGVLIGTSAAMLLYANGRIAGISGIAAGLLDGPKGDGFSARLAFVLGLILGAAACFAAGIGPVPEMQASRPLLVVAGLLVGFGTRFGGGCTSGHGVCGLGRLSRRSLVATLVFMASGFATVFVTRHLL